MEEKKLLEEIQKLLSQTEQNTEYILSYKISFKLTNFGISIEKPIEANDPLSLQIEYFKIGLQLILNKIESNLSGINNIFTHTNALKLAIQNIYEFAKINGNLINCPDIVTFYSNTRIIFELIVVHLFKINKIFYNTNETLETLILILKNSLNEKYKAHYFSIFFQFKNNLNPKNHRINNYSITISDLVTTISIFHTFLDDIIKYFLIETELTGIQNGKRKNIDKINPDGIICKTFEEKGKCNYGEYCRFLHIESKLDCNHGFYCEDPDCKLNHRCSPFYYKMSQIQSFTEIGSNGSSTKKRKIEINDQVQ